jgi:hypothetical protein
VNLRLNIYVMVFWMMTQCSPVGGSHCFRGIHCFHVQGWRWKHLPSYTLSDSVSSGWGLSGCHLWRQSRTFVWCNSRIFLTMWATVSFKCEALVPYSSLFYVPFSHSASCPLGRVAVWSDKSLPVFRRNVFLPSSVRNNNRDRKFPPNFGDDLR